MEREEEEELERSETQKSKQKQMLRLNICKNSMSKIKMSQQKEMLGQSLFFFRKQTGDGDNTGKVSFPSAHHPQPFSVSCLCQDRGKRGEEGEGEGRKEVVVFYVQMPVPPCLLCLSPVRCKCVAILHMPCLFFFFFFMLQNTCPVFWAQRGHRHVT